MNDLNTSFTTFLAGCVSFLQSNDMQEADRNKGKLGTVSYFDTNHQELNKQVQNTYFFPPRHDWNDRCVYTKHLHLFHYCACVCLLFRECTGMLQGVFLSRDNLWASSAHQGHRCSMCYSGKLWKHASTLKWIFTHQIFSSPYISHLISFLKCHK